MAKIGERLTAPEIGWKRYDDSDNMITYVGSGWVRSNEDSYNGNLSHSKTNEDSIQFNFTGDKLRIIDQMHPNRSKNINVIIDGQMYTYSANGDNHPQSLVFEVKKLSLEEHCVRIFRQSEGYIALDALDIDYDGELKPYSPPQKTLLRVTMLDSSERDYQLSTTEIDSFINWYMKHTSTDTTGYMLTKKVGTEVSKEYLTLDKIISFEVIER